MRFHWNHHQDLLLNLTFRGDLWWPCLLHHSALHTGYEHTFPVLSIISLFSNQLVHLTFLSKAQFYPCLWMIYEHQDPPRFRPVFSGRISVLNCPTTNHLISDFFSHKRCWCVLLRIQNIHSEFQVVQLLLFLLVVPGLPPLALPVCSLHYILWQDGEFCLAPGTVLLSAKVSLPSSHPEWDPKIHCVTSPRGWLNVIFIHCLAYHFFSYSSVW